MASASPHFHGVLRPSNQHSHYRSSVLPFRLISFVNVRYWSALSNPMDVCKPRPAEHFYGPRIRIAHLHIIKYGNIKHKKHVTNKQRFNMENVNILYFIWKNMIRRNWPFAGYWSTEQWPSLKKTLPTPGLWFFKVGSMTTAHRVPWRYDKRKKSSVHIVQYVDCHKQLPPCFVNEMISQSFAIENRGCCAILKFAVKSW